MKEFILDAKLEADSLFIANLELSQIRLINNSDYTWIILVPRINNLIEITDLDSVEYIKFCNEIKAVAIIIQKLFNPDKLNIAAIGNVVRQLHMHIIARFKDDKLFPKPIWGCEFKHYSKNELELKITKLSAAIIALKEAACMKPCGVSLG